MMSDPHSTAPPDPFSFADWWNDKKGWFYIVAIIVGVIFLFSKMIMYSAASKAAKEAAQRAARDAKVVTVSTGKRYYPYQYVQHAYFALNGTETVKDKAYWIGNEQYIFRLEGSLVCVDRYRGMDSCLPYDTTEAIKTEFMNVCHAVGYANCPTP